MQFGGGRGSYVRAREGGRGGGASFKGASVICAVCSSESHQMEIIFRFVLSRFEKKKIEL